MCLSRLIVAASAIRFLNRGIDMFLSESRSTTLLRKWASVAESVGILISISSRVEILLVARCGWRTYFRHVFQTVSLDLWFLRGICSASLKKIWVARVGCNKRHDAARCCILLWANKVVRITSNGNWRAGFIQVTSRLSALRCCWIVSFGRSLTMKTTIYLNMVLLQLSVKTTAEVVGT